MNQFSYQQNKNIIDLSLFSLMKKRILQLYFQLLARLQSNLNKLNFIVIDDLMVSRAYESSRLYRDLKLRGAFIHSGNLRLLPKVNF